MKEDIERGKKQADEFKAKYGDYPKMPIKIHYKFGTMAGVIIGKLVPTRFGYMIEGFPGMIGAGDESVKNVKFLKDAEGRIFPNVDEKEANDEGVTVHY